MSQNRCLGKGVSRRIMPSVRGYASVLLPSVIAQQRKSPREPEYVESAEMGQSGQVGFVSPNCA